MFPAWNMLRLIQNLSHHEICHKLHPDQYADHSFSSTDDNTPHTSRTNPASTPEYSEDEEEEEDFQMVPLNNDHWTS